MDPTVQELEALHAAELLGAFIKGFYCKITSIMCDQLWGVLSGLRVAWNMTLPKMILECDSKVVVDLISRGHSHSPALFMLE